MANKYYSIEELLHSDSFRDWAQGRATSREKREWDRWVRTSPRHRWQARRAQAKLNGFSFQSRFTPHSSAAWKRLQDRMEEENKLGHAPIARTRNRRSWIYYTAVASVVLVLISILTALWAYRPTVQQKTSEIATRTITTAYGQRKHLSFSGGKSIVLGPHSKLSYEKERKAGRSKHITLRGEAYFEADPHVGATDTAFQIRTPQGQVADLGTKFVVSTRDRQTRVILKTGIVAITQRGAHANSLLLEPGQMATIQEASHFIRVKSVNPEVFTSWSSDRIVLDDTPLRFITKRLEQNFGVKVTIMGDKLPGRMLSGSIQNRGLKTIVSSLADALDTDYTITGDRIYIGNHTANANGTQ